jgi:hypothetical protein
MHLIWRAGWLGEDFFLLADQGAVLDIAVAMYFHFGPQTLSTISIIHPSIRITTQARVFPVPFHTTRPPTTLTIPLQKLQHLVPEKMTKLSNQFSRDRGAPMQHLSLTTPFQHLRDRPTATIATALHV